MDWFAEVRDRPVGSRSRVHHDCGLSPALSVLHREDAFVGHCFRCGERLYEAKERPSTAEILASRRAQEAQDETLQSTPCLPTPMNFDRSTWPVEALVWLGRSGIGGPEAEALGIYHHEPTNRTVIPVFDQQGEVIHWTARGYGDGAKYLSAPDSRSKTAKFGIKAGPVALTEDILSAYNVGKVVEAWALLGTSLSTTTRYELIRRGQPVVLMLDPDWDRPYNQRPGREAARRIQRELSGWLPVHSMVLRADPKYLSKREILNIIGAVL